MKNHNSKDAFYNRLQQLAEVKKPTLTDNTRNLGTLIDYKRAADGVAYGIVKENHHYYIKKAGLKQDPNVADFAYVGGLGNISEFQYKSLAEADKQRNMMFHTINEAVALKPSKTGSKTTGKKRLNEDKAGKEIEKAASQIDNLDAATASADAPAPAPEPEMPVDTEVPMDASPEPAPEVGTEVPAEAPAPEGGEESAPETDAAPEGGEGEDVAPEGGEEAPVGEKDITTTEIEKSLGKLTNKIRKTELEPAQVKSYVNSFLTAFKDKFDEVEIEDRKIMADKILKVVPDEDVEDLGSSLPPEEQEVEEQACSECGGFAQYAESRGYTAESIQECGEEEMSNLVSGYANAHNDGQNDGDFKAVALFITPEIIEKLKGDYGHDEYAEKLTPYANSMNEVSAEDKVAQINELFGGLGQLGKKAGQAIGGAVKSAGQAIGGAAQKVNQAVGQAATNVKQTYYAGEKNAALNKLQTLATDLGKQVAAVNDKAVKAGEQPINVQSLLQTITSQVQKTGGANLGKFRTAEGVDPANVEVQPEMLKEEDEVEEPEAGEVEKTEEKPEVGFAPDAQVLGGGVLKPDGAPTTGVDININPDKSVNISMNEAKQKLIKQIADGVNAYLSEATKGKGKPFVKPAPKAKKVDETVTITDSVGDGDPFDKKTKKVNETEKPSAGLSKEKKSDVVKAAKAGKDLGKPGKGFEKVAQKAAKEYGSKEKGEKVAAAAMWKNIKKEGVEEKATMSESEQKLRKYIRARLEEKAGLRKPILTESKKSETLKKLDSIIDKQYQLFESTIVKKKGELNEIFGFSTKEKFAKLNPEDSVEVEKMLVSTFDILRNPQYANALLKARKMTSTPEKYEILKQYVQNDGGTLRTSGGKLVYAPKAVQDKATPVGGGHVFGAGA